MSDYLTQPQQDVLLRPISRGRVGTTPQGMSHVEAYEIRAHLNRVFGFARWSAEVTAQQMVFEDSTTKRKKNKQGEEYGDPYTAWTVCYRTILRLTVCAKDGTVLASYSEGATGQSQNQPSRGDAHDNALKTSESQALKRCATNLGDQFGLSLYKKGSLNPLVRELVPDEWAQGEEHDVTAHVTETPPEDESVVPAAPIEYETSGRDPVVAAQAGMEPDLEAWRTRILALCPDGVKPNIYYARLQADAAKAGVLGAMMANRDGEQVTAKRLIDTELDLAKAGV